MAIGKNAVSKDLIAFFMGAFLILVSAIIYILSVSVLTNVEIGPYSTFTFYAGLLCVIFGMVMVFLKGKYDY